VLAGTPQSDSSSPPLPRRALGVCCYSDGLCRLTPGELCATLIADADCNGAMIQDYDWMCPYGGSAPDVAYQFIPSQDVVVDISLSFDETDYDTKLLVFESACRGAPIACNDDLCSTASFPYPYVSKVEHVPLDAGGTYYIVVSGYGQACGTYHLEISAALPGAVTGPAAATPEN
jgi:hypothetical protein